MIERCTNPNNKRFRTQGKRGIKVCDSWRFGADGKGGFGCYFAYVSEHLFKPLLSGMSIDRIDNNGNYEPGNIRWATDSMQSANSRRGKKRSGYLFASEASDTAVISSGTSGGTATPENDRQLTNRSNGEPEIIASVSGGGAETGLLRGNERH